MRWYRCVDRRVLENTDMFQTQLLNHQNVQVQRNDWGYPKVDALFMWKAGNNNTSFKCTILWTKQNGRFNDACQGLGRKVACSIIWWVLILLISSNVRSLVDRSIHYDFSFRAYCEFIWSYKAHLDVHKRSLPVCTFCVWAAAGRGSQAVMESIFG